MSMFNVRNLNVKSNIRSSVKQTHCIFLVLDTEQISGFFLPLEGKLD